MAVVRPLLARQKRVVFFVLVKNVRNCNIVMSSNRWWVQKLIRRRKRKRMEIQIFTKDVSGIDEEIEFPQILDRTVELSFPGRTF